LTSASAQNVSAEYDRSHRWDWSVLSELCRRETERALGPSADAQDAAQEAVVRAWRRRHTCDDPARPAPWVRAIARREALRIAARRQEEPLEAVPEPATASHEEAALTRIVVRRLVASLPEPERALLHAVYWEDLTGAEASRRTGQVEATLRVRLHRARRSLKSSIQHCSGGVG
jgi:RNA polymerase sigma-70 factor (ECF subfamily)